MPQINKLAIYMALFICMFTTFSCSQLKSKQKNTATKKNYVIGGGIPYNLSPKKYVNVLKSEIGINCYFDYDEALNVAKQLKRPVLLDFTGHTCISCRKMERAVLSKPEVLRELKEHFIVASLYCDDRQSLWNGETYTAKNGDKLTTLGEKNVDIEVNKYGEISQPIYIFVDEYGNIIKKAGGYVDGVPRFLNIMKEVKEKYNACKK